MFKGMTAFSAICSYLKPDILNVDIWQTVKEPVKPHTLNNTFMIKLDV
jgi:hypothetical protein